MDPVVHFVSFNDPDGNRASILEPTPANKAKAKNR